MVDKPVFFQNLDFPQSGTLFFPLIKQNNNGFFELLQLCVCFLFFYEAKTCYSTHPEFQLGNTATKQACCYGITRNGTSKQLPKIQCGVTSSSHSPSPPTNTVLLLMFWHYVYKKSLVRVLFGLYLRKNNKISPSPILSTQSTFVTFHFFFSST